MKPTFVKLAGIWLLLLLGVTQGGPPSASVAIVPGSERQRPVQGRSVGKSVGLTAGQANLKLRFEDGREGYAYLFWLWDPDSRLFLWTVHYDGDTPYPDATRMDSVLNEASVQVSNGTLNYFAHRVMALYVQRSNEVFETIDDGLGHAVATVEANLPGIIDESFQHTFRRLPLRGPIPFDFFHKPLSASAATVSRIASVQRQGDGWRVELEGEGSRRAVVRLNANLEMVEAKELRP